MEAVSGSDSGAAVAPAVGRLAVERQGVERPRAARPANASLKTSTASYLRFTVVECETYLARLEVTGAVRDRLGYGLPPLEDQGASSVLHLPL